MAPSTATPAWHFRCLLMGFQRDLDPALAYCLTLPVQPITQISDFATGEPTATSAHMSANRLYFHRIRIMDVSTFVHLCNLEKLINLGYNFQSPVPTDARGLGSLTLGASRSLGLLSSGPLGSTIDHKLPLLQRAPSSNIVDAPSTPNPFLRSPGTKRNSVSRTR